jgi:hypothetical protein
MKQRILLFYFLLVIMLLGGCSSQEEPPTPRSEATKKLIQILENDYAYKPVVRWAGETLWIYLPCEENLYKISAGEGSSKATTKTFNLEFIEGAFQDNIFSFEYDIIPATKVSAGSGMGTGYSEAFHTRYQNITNTLSQSFFSVDSPPRFVVIIIADIKEGLLIKNTLYMMDLKKYYTSSLPPDEYSLRIKTDFLGDKKMIGDDKGRGLECSDVVWSDFLINQMIRRIQFKFQNSDFPPQEIPQEEILKMIAMVTMIYDFNDYTTVVLNDLRGQKEETFSRAQIEERQDQSILKKEKEPAEGRVITFDFSQFLKEQPTEPLPPEELKEPSLQNQQPIETETNTTL